MATVNFSVPDEVKQEFNRIFANENKSAMLTRLMQRAIEEHKSQQRRAAAMDSLLKLRADFPAMDREAREEARNEGRA
ncbi:MAG: hypothetical protein R3F02_17510 [Thiolinea sp.]